MYVVTICTADRRPLFGHVVDDAVELNAIGRIVDEEWRRTPILRSNIDLDAYIIMPNHIHGIIVINESKPVSLPRGRTGEHHTGPPHTASQTIGAIVRGFKGATTSRAVPLQNHNLQSIWQRGYHEHVIRSEGALQRIREYILTNPLRWSLDRYFRGDNTIVNGPCR